MDESRGSSVSPVNRLTVDDLVAREPSRSPGPRNRRLTVHRQPSPSPTRHSSSWRSSLFSDDEQVSWNDGSVELLTDLFK